MSPLFLFLALFIFLPNSAVAGDIQLYTVLESGLYANPRYYSVNPRLGIVWEIGSSETPAIVVPPPGQSSSVILLPPPRTRRSMASTMNVEAWDAEFEAMNADLDRDDLIMRQLFMMQPEW